MYRGVGVQAKKSRKAQLRRIMLRNNGSLTNPRSFTCISRPHLVPVPVVLTMYFYVYRIAQENISVR